MKTFEEASNKVSGPIRFSGWGRLRLESTGGVSLWE